MMIVVVVVVVADDDYNEHDDVVNDACVSCFMFFSFFHLYYKYESTFFWLMSYTYLICSQMGWLVICILSRIGCVWP